MEKMEKKNDSGLVMRIRAVPLVLAVAAILVVGGCSKGEQDQGMPVPGIVADPPVIQAIRVIPDPSLQEITRKDPYAQLSSYALEAYTPDRELYNALYGAVERMETEVDVSRFPLTLEEKSSTMDALYYPAGFELYPVHRLNLTRDGRMVRINYHDTTEDMEEERRIFFSRRSHLIHNVALDSYSELQKLFAVYDAVSVHADYTDDISVVTSHTPYSILMDGKGICGGFSSLGYDILNRAGVETMYAINDPHAWNLVRIDGEWYHSDLTWSAGNYGSPYNAIRDILMDEDQRDLSLEYYGYGGSPIIEGYLREGAKAPVPATDDRFRALYEFYYEYALDVDRGAVYFSSAEGIMRMNLEGKEMEKLSPMSGSGLQFFDGILYFIGEEDGFLYRLVPGREPECLDDSVKAGTLNVARGVLSYGEGERKTLDLNPFVPSAADLQGSSHQESVTIPLQQTFRMEISFSKPMDRSVLPKDAVGLVDQDGKAIPIHMVWNEEGNILMVRAKDFLDGETAVTLVAAPGILAKDGEKTAASRDLSVEIR